MIQCGIILNTSLLSFTGRIQDEHTSLQWTTTREDEPLIFDVEKSTDGVNFSVIASINSYQDYRAENNQYHFTDPVKVMEKVYYRIKMKNQAGHATSSRTIQLSLAPLTLSFESVINPFSNQLNFQVSTAESGMADAELIDPAGKLISKKSFDLSNGLNNLVIGNLDNLARGIYMLRVQLHNKVLQRTVYHQ